MTSDPTLNAELGQLLGATPAREWRVEFPDGKWWRWESEAAARRVAQANGGVAVEKVKWPDYSASRDLMAGVEDELERRGLATAYGQRFAELMFAGEDAKPGDSIEVWEGEDFFALAHAPPDLRARAARDVLKAGEKGQADG
jgi:hypothetical protein